MSPIQDGANKALKPVRDAVGWVGDTLDAKTQRNQLRRQSDKLRRELVADQGEKRSYHELLGMFHLDNQLSVANYRPVTATVFAKSVSPKPYRVMVSYSSGRSRRGVSPTSNNVGQKALPGPA